MDMDVKKDGGGAWVECDSLQCMCRAALGAKMAEPKSFSELVVCISAAFGR